MVKRFRSSKILEKLSLRPVCYLFVLFVVFGLLSSVSFLYKSYRVIHNDYCQKLAYLNQLQVQNAEMTFEQYETMLRITGNRLVEAGVDRYPEKGRHIIESMKTVNESLVGLGIIRPDGQLLLVSTIPAGVPLPNLLDDEQSRAGYNEVMATDHLLLGRSFFMKQLAQWTVPMRVALRDEMNGEVHHVMAAGLSLTDKVGPWSHGNLDDGIVTTVVRGSDGYIMAKNPCDINFAQLFTTPLTVAEMATLEKIKNDPQSSVTVTPGMLAAGHYLAKYDLYIITEEPVDHLYSEWKRSSMPLLLVLLASAALAIVVFRYISCLYRHAQAKIIFQATHDSLTGLPNRQMIYEQIEKKIAESSDEHGEFAVLFLDLDNFKQINDNFGHSVGDDVLKKMARRLVHDDDFWLVGRQGGDEFIVVTGAINNSDEIHRIAHKLLKIAGENISIESYEINLGTSVGVSIYPHDGSDADTLLRSADTALYKSKAIKRGQYLFYCEEMNRQSQRRLVVENQLRKSVQRQELTVHYQPLYQPHTDDICGCEALLRWKNSELGVVSPDEFISVAEDSGLIEELGLFVLERALTDIKQLNDQRTAELKVAVNVSTKQLLYSPIVWQLQDLLHRFEVSPSMLKIEITESVLIEDFDRAIEVLRQISQLGILLSIDDFGTGYSSLAYLSKLPCEEIKIDRSFIQNILTHRDDESLVQSIIAMAKALNRTIVAEGVETAEHLEKLTAFGCDIIQGYHISRPIPLDEFTAFLGQYDDCIR
ncbi:MAG: EAL domain-containing protein [Desulfuromonas sp.]|nr:EAL domain-containing protein [Desulfuromonas sp.]